MGDAVASAIAAAKAEGSLAPLVRLWREGYALSDDEASEIAAAIKPNLGRPAKRDETRRRNQRLADLVLEFRARRDVLKNQRAANAHERALAEVKILYPEIAENVARNAIEGKNAAVRALLKFPK